MKITKKVKYSRGAEEEAINANKDSYSKLVGIQNITEGDFLVFAVDFKKMYADARSIEEKINVIAKMLELVD